MRVLLVATAGLMLTAAAFCQQVRKFRTSTVEFKIMELDWDTDVVEFSGGCKLTVGGPFNATMTAPAMTAKVSGKPATLKSLVAKGPVNFTVITRPNSQGLKRKITASAKEQATYSEDTQTVRLVGDAVADMVPLDGGVEAESMHFTGQTVIANLKTNRMSVDNGDLTVKTQME
jgi:lipopolysaccharide export system protein LptA